MGEALRFLAHYVSTYLYFVICGAILIATMLGIVPQTSPYLPVDTKLSNFSQDPTWFVHASDLHISELYPASLAHYKTFLRVCNSTLFPQEIVITGDIVDIYRSRKHPCTSNPNLTQWMLYSSLRNESNINSSQFFEILGNHDSWGIRSKNGVNDYASENTRESITDFASSITVGDVRIISFFPVTFPSGFGIHNYVVTLTPDMLDSLEAAILEPTSATSTIVALHFNYLYIFPKGRTSKSGRTYESIINQLNVSAVLTGHTHPPDFEPYHIGNAIEVTAPSLRDSALYGVFTFDNGRFSYSTVDISSPSPTVLTYPISSRIASKIYSENSFDIRLLSFSSSAQTFIVSGDVNGTMNRTKQIQSGVWLYTLPATLSNGKHTIRISGNANIVCNFSIGVTDGGFKETQRIMFDSYGIVVGTVLFFVLNVFILLGSFFPDSIMKNTMKVVDFLNKKEEKCNWIYALLLGPLVIGGKLRCLPLWLRISLCILVLWPICLPNVVFEVGGEPIMMWMYGYAARGGYFRNDILSTAFALAYELSVGFISCAFSSLLHSKLSYIFIIDCIIFIALFAFGEFVGWRFGEEVAFYGRWATSTYFVLIPAIYAIEILGHILKFLSDQNEVANESKITV